MSHSKSGATRIKPAKPYPDFTPFPHATGRWAKKIRQKLHYFGPWSDPNAALQKYLDEKDDLHAGRTPQIESDELTIRDLANRYLTAKRQLVDDGEITARSHQAQHLVCKQIVDFFGLNRRVSNLTSDDFPRFRANLSKTLGLLALATKIQMVKAVFNYGFQSGVIKEAVRYGPDFKSPGKKSLRKARNGNARRLFTAAEIHNVLENASIPMKAMILLGINAGFGNSDCSSLPLSAVNLDDGWVDFPRVKTGIDRRVPLWPETVKALRKVISARPIPKEKADKDLVFLTKRRNRWVRLNENNTCLDGVGRAFSLLLHQQEMKRLGVGFYALRHTFATIGGESIDQVAVNSIMGHADQSMAATYRERISDKRLIAVTNHVHNWLWPQSEKES